MRSFKKPLFASLLMLIVASPCVLAEEADVEDFIEYPLAIMPFRERGEEVKGMGGQASDLLFANLATNPSLWLVDREDLEKTISEQELNLSGIVTPTEAIQIGQVTGAKIIITGSVFQVGNSMYVVAKVIGTETTRVLGASAKGDLGDGLDSMIEDLAADVQETIAANSAKLVAAPVSKKDRMAAVAKELADAKRPAVMITIDERHVGRMQFDPAAETEVAMFCKEAGFTVIDPKEGSEKQAQVLIKGEGMSEFATRRGDLISVKARLEMKAIDRATGRIIAVDRQTRVAVDLTEQVAAKNALQEAAADIAERLLPKLVQAKVE